MKTRQPGGVGIQSTFFPNCYINLSGNDVGIICGSLPASALWQIQNSTDGSVCLYNYDSNVYLRLAGPNCNAWNKNGCGTVSTSTQCGNLSKFVFQVGRDGIAVNSYTNSNLNLRLDANAMVVNAQYYTYGHMGIAYETFTIQGIRNSCLNYGGPACYTADAQQIESAYFPSCYINRNPDGVNGVGVICTGGSVAAPNTAMWSVQNQDDGTFCLLNKVSGTYLAFNAASCTQYSNTGCGITYLANNCKNNAKFLFINGAKGLSLQSQVNPNAFIRLDGTDNLVLNGQYYNGTAPAGYENFLISGIPNNCAYYVGGICFSGWSSYYRPLSNGQQFLIYSTANMYLLSPTSNAGEASNQIGLGRTLSLCTSQYAADATCNPTKQKILTVNNVVGIQGSWTINGEAVYWNAAGWNGTPCATMRPFSPNDSNYTSSYYMWTQFDNNIGPLTLVSVSPDSAQVGYVNTNAGPANYFTFYLRNN